MKKSHKRKVKFIIPVVILLVLFLFVGYIGSQNIQVLNTKGVVASKEKRLIIESTLLMLLVIVPVYILTFSIAWKYRATNKKALYQPDFDHHRGLEAAWWAIPGVIIVILSVITWQSSHSLDPFKPLASAKKPLHIQVVALQWRWLFIYPDQKIATVNYMEIPAKTPVDFDITSDAPMNSFWIPQLGGQIYAMPGMSTQLHLSADHVGTYRGSSANISGEGFASMVFSTKAVHDAEYTKWAEDTSKAAPPLTISGYKALSKPNEDTNNLSFSLVEPALYDQVVAKYLLPGGDLSGPVHESHAGHHD